MLHIQEGGGRSQVGYLDTSLELEAPRRGIRFLASALLLVSIMEVSVASILVYSLAFCCFGVFFYFVLFWKHDACCVVVHCVFGISLIAWKIFVSPSPPLSCPLSTALVVSFPFFSHAGVSFDTPSSTQLADTATGILGEHLGSDDHTRRTRGCFSPRPYLGVLDARSCSKLI